MPMLTGLVEKLAQAAGLLVAAKDDEGRYVYGNPRFRSAFGFPEGLPPGLTDDQIFPPAVAARSRRHDQVALDSGQPSLHEEALSGGPGERNYLFSHFALDDSAAPAKVGMIGFEIANSATRPDELLASHPLFKEILDIAADAIISIDEGQHIVMFNQGAERIFGYRADEIIGRPLIDLLPNGARPAHERHVAHFGRSRSGPRQMGERGAISGRRKNGEVFPAEASISRVQVGGRTVYTAILRDTTEARRAEQAIKALNADLERRALQLEQANRELEAFSYSVSHDLRAPLRSIDGFSQLLLEDYLADLPDDAQDSLQRIRAASQRMAQLIDDMLALSRVTRGAIDCQQVDFSAMVRAALDELRSAQPDRAVTTVIADGVTAYADPHLMPVVFSNLVGNAWKYTSKHPTARIEFGVTRTADGQTAYFVRDDGAGFDMAYSQKLFGVFQRLHGMTEYPGTGVGLATVQRIIHKHGGTVWAEAAVEQGATFYFTLNEREPKDVPAADSSG